MGKPKAVSKNARRVGGDVLTCKMCDGKIIMRSVFTKGSMKHFAQCTGCNATSRRPKDLMKSLDRIS